IFASEAVWRRWRCTGGGAFLPVGNSCATAASTGLADSRSVMASSFESKGLSVGTGVFGDPKRTCRARNIDLPETTTRCCAAGAVSVPGDHGYRAASQDMGGVGGSWSERRYRHY